MISKTRGSAMKNKFKNFRKKIKDEKGQAVVELAVTLPLLLLILCGIIDFGWLFYNKLTIGNYTREAARYAITAGSSETASTLTNKIRTKVSNLATLYSPDNISVEVKFSEPANISEGDITVEVTGLVSSLTPITRTIATNGKIKVSSAVTMRME